MRHQQRVGGKRAGRKGAPGVKAKPSYPEQSCANDCKGYIVRHHDLGSEILPAAEYQSSGKRGEASARVDNDASGKVKHAQLCKPSPSPDPVRKRVVDEQAPCHDKDYKRAPLDSLGKGAGDKQRSNDSEHHLECCVRHARHRRRVVDRVVERDVVVEQPVKAADKSVLRRSEYEREPEDEPQC